MPNQKIGQKELRDIFDGAAGVTEDGLANLGAGIEAIKVLIIDGKVKKAQARNLFAYYAESGYAVDEAWAMLGQIENTARKPRIEIGSKIDRKLHAGKNGRKGLYISMEPYADSDEVRVTYSKNQVLIKGIGPEDAEA